MKFYCDVDADKVVYGIGRFEDGVMEVEDPKDIKYMKKHYKYDEVEKDKLEPKKESNEQPKKLTKEDLVKKSGGWYEFPDGTNVRGDEVEDKLKEWNN